MSVINPLVRLFTRIHSSYHVLKESRRFSVNEPRKIDYRSIYFTSERKASQKKQG